MAVAHQVVGLILTTALLVTLAATASLVTKRPPQTMPLADELSVLAAMVGLLLSFHLGVPFGSAIVLTAVAGVVAVAAGAAVRTTGVSANRVAIRNVVSMTK